MTESEVFMRGVSVVGVAVLVAGVGWMAAPETAGACSVSCGQGRSLTLIEVVPLEEAEGEPPEWPPRADLRFGPDGVAIDLVVDGSFIALTTPEVAR